MNIAIVCLHSKEYQPLADLTVAQNKALYCERWAKPLFVNVVEETNANRAGYDRMVFVLELMAAHPEVEWFWVMGVDTLIMNFNLGMSAFIPCAPAHCLIANDGNSLNGDSVIFRNSTEGKALLEHLLSERSMHEVHPWADSMAMTVAKLHPKWGLMIEVVPQKSFNSYPADLYTHQAGTFAEYEEGDFIVHWPGQSLEKRIELAKEYLPKVKI